MDLDYDDATEEEAGNKRPPDGAAAPTGDRPREK
eukprot:CAMPEP_0197175690 /NCGR_PEP_ID=MMETSP1423-20130617/1839_1 /TAXON_ID=476441 /ORGANISM="Pseudo-nitzschia heimii, Strain UNC1101" /LENGTH=33 /DNA_ID= /DNA_START= /DNA_END= /DNA_ORIENTATION=